MHCGIIQFDRDKHAVYAPISTDFGHLVAAFADKRRAYETSLLLSKALAVPILARERITLLRGSARRALSSQELVVRGLPAPALLLSRGDGELATVALYSSLDEATRLRELLLLAAWVALD